MDSLGVKSAWNFFDICIIIVISIQIDDIKVLQQYCFQELHDTGAINKGF